MSKPRISVRLTESQMQILTELSDKLNAPISLLVRAFVGDFITRNEIILESIITGEREINNLIDYENDTELS